MAPDGQIIVRKMGTRAARKPTRFDAIRGSATAGMSTDEIMALTRGED